MNDREKEFEERINCGIAYCEDTAIEEIEQDFKMQEEKNKQIEEICSLLFCDKWELPFTECPEDIRCIDCIARKLYEQGYRKIPKDSIILTSEEYEILKIKEKEKHWLQTCMSVWKNGKIDGGKETAEKIYLQAKATVNTTKHIVQVREYLHIDALKEIVKSYGVEIKE